jgi:hypothetical protein
MAVKKPTSKTPAKSRTGSSNSKLNSLPKVNKWLALLFVAVIAGVGAYIIFRANAATNNCQTVNPVAIAATPATTPAATTKPVPAGTDKATTPAATPAAPANDKNAVQVCDVDMALGNDTTVLSTKGWADELGKQGFWYFGAVFRAPTTAYAGAVPISAVYNESTTYRDYMTVAQKSLKDSAFPGKTKNEGVAFYAWENPGQPDTVPVYRITQGGSATKTFYSTDLGTINRLLAEDQNVVDGWRKDQFAGSSFIAFYAYPPNYAVAKQPNPYDCSILANYVSDRCAGSRAALDAAVAAGNVPVGKDCPATLEIYRKAPFASQFDQACQDKWNTYMNNCGIQENFVSDRCKKERQAFVDAEAEQARQRAAAAAAQRTVVSTSSSRGGGGTPTRRSTPTRNPATPTPPVTDPGCNDACQKYWQELYRAQQLDTNRLSLGNFGGVSNRGNPAVRDRLGECEITWKMDKFWGTFGSTTGRTVYPKITSKACTSKFNNAKNKTIDGSNRRHYDYKKFWNGYY